MVVDQGPLKSEHLVADRLLGLRCLYKLVLIVLVLLVGTLLRVVVPLHVLRLSVAHHVLVWILDGG